MLLSAQELSFIGASLYLCEGTKRRVDNRGYVQYAVEFTNNDPRTIKLFLNFLREVIKANENRIKAELFAYPDHNELSLLDFWSNLTRIPKQRFHKTILLRQKNIKFKPSPLGTLKIRYFHKEHFLKIQGIIEDIFGSQIRLGEVA